MTDKWIILSGGWDPHILKADNWYEALISHVIWCGYASKSSNKIDTYKIAFKGFTDMKQAIELFNMMHDADRIDYMAKINEEAFLDVRMKCDETN